MSTDLIPKIALSPTALFTGGGIDEVLAEIEKRATTAPTAADTAKARAEIKSMAYKVSQSKTFLDNIGKELVADLKRQVGMIDPVRKRTRDFLDDLKARVRQPLTDWEAAEEAKEAAEKLKQQIEECHAEALSMNDLFDREKAVQIQAAELRRQAEENARIAREEQIRRQAAENAKREAELAAEMERKAAEQKAEAEKRELIRKEMEAQEALRRAQAEKEMLQIAEAKRAKEEADRAAAEKARADAEQRRIEEDKEMRRRVEAAAIQDFVECGFQEGIARIAVNLISQGQIRGVSIDYRSGLK